MFRPLSRSLVIPVAAALVLLVSAWGCGSSEPGLVPVRGKVTLNGGPWPKEGTINFTPAGTVEGADPTKSRPGSAKFTTDGYFTAGSFEAGDGLFPGTYNVALDCLESPPQMTNTGKVIEGKNAAPLSYRNPSTSGLTLTVDANQRVDATFDVKAK
ncbi:hypothetical protein [Singulisphaera acidiphila]|uniref:hypothetical protein n=1 Tax=Singulisphaera acidiphila TaxID=466153 RepID=UPI001ED8F2E1|nr:hypothetical protein [Singulisphaera acidiphila]